VKRVNHLEEIRTLPSLMRFELNCEEGDEIVKTVDIRTDCGYVLLYHSDPDVERRDYETVLRLQPTMIDADGLEEMEEGIQYDGSDGDWSGRGEGVDLSDSYGYSPDDNGFGPAGPPSAQPTRVVAINSQGREVFGGRKKSLFPALRYGALGLWTVACRLLAGVARSVFTTRQGSWGAVWTVSVRYTFRTALFLGSAMLLASLAAVLFGGQVQPLSVPS